MCPLLEQSAVIVLGLKAAGKRKEGSKCSAQGMEKTGSFTFFPYSLSEIFETEAAIDGFAHFSLWGCRLSGTVYSLWCHCGEGGKETCSTAT